MTVFKDEWLVKILLKRKMIDSAKIDEIRSTNIQGVQDYLSDKIVALGYIDPKEFSLLHLYHFEKQHGL